MGKLGEHKKIPASAGIIRRGTQIESKHRLTALTVCLLGALFSWTEWRCDYVPYPLERRCNNIEAKI